MSTPKEIKAIRSRKWTIVKWLIFMFFYLSALITVLVVLRYDVPQALGLSLGVCTSAIAGYIGVNVWQKKIQNGNGKSHHVEDKT